MQGKIPTVAQLSLGELAINTFDGKVFLSQDKSSVGIATTVIAINPWSVGPGTSTYNTYFTSGSVGVGSTLPTSKLDVVGDAKFTGVVTATTFYGNIYSTGISTISGFKFPSTDGTDGQFLKTDGFGNLSFATSSGGSGGATGAATSISQDYFTATQGQTVFTTTQNFTDKSVQVFINGIKLRSTIDYTTTNPSTVTLVGGITANDRVSVIISFGNTLEEQTFTATSGQTTFSPSGSFANPENIKIYVNGIKLRKTIDYGASSSISLITQAKFNDEIDLVCDNAEDYFTAFEGQIIFTPTSTNINSNNLQVFLNGVILEKTQDYIIQSPAINFVYPLIEGDEVDIVITRS